MTDVRLVVSTAGMDEALKALDPQQVYVILNTWYDRATRLVAGELRNRAKPSLKSKVYINMDTLRPPRWARIGVKSRIARLLEGGTGKLGDVDGKHIAQHWPSTTGIMRETGLPERQAFLVARSIGLRGGNPPQPFIRPTWEATHVRIEAMMGQIAVEVLK